MELWTKKIAILYISTCDPQWKPSLPGLGQSQDKRRGSLNPIYIGQERASGCRADAKGGGSTQHARQVWLSVKIIRGPPVHGSFVLGTTATRSVQKHSKTQCQDFCHVVYLHVRRKSELSEKSSTCGNQISSFKI